MTDIPGDPLDGYVATMERRPLLGHLVYYSIFDSPVTPDQLELWFAELGLDKQYLPGPIRPVDAYEKVTGKAQRSYRLDGELDGGPRRRARDGKRHEATLLVREFFRDDQWIIRHVVREERNEEHAEHLEYEARVANCEFKRDGNPHAVAGAGSLVVTVDEAELGRLAPGEQDEVRAFLKEIEEGYERHRLYLSGDRLRGMLRAYVEGLNAVRVRQTGGVYFLQRRHADTVAALRGLVSRFGAGSRFWRVPLPDDEEMREMVIAEFVERAREDLQKLAGEIDKARRGGRASARAIEKLYGRFRRLQEAKEQHAALLNTSIDDADAAMQMVQAQLAALLSEAQ